MRQAAAAATAHPPPLHAGLPAQVGPELEIPGYGCEDHFTEHDTVEHSWVRGRMCCHAMQREESAAGWLLASLCVCRRHAALLTLPACLPSPACRSALLS